MFALAKMGMAIFSMLYTAPCQIANKTSAWIYSETIPKLVGKSIIKRNRVLIANGDPPFRLLTQKWINTVAFNNCKSKEAILVIQTVRYWLERLVKNVRYHYEYDDCIWSINKYIDSNTTVLGSCLLPMKEIISSLQTYRSYWANCYHKHTPLMPTIQQNHTLSQ